VLHIDELTYSIAALQAEPRVGGDIITSYRRLSLGLVAGLRLLGCDVVQAHEQHVAMAGTAKAVSAACFDVPSHYEITASGRKLVGSAQVRRRGVVLQHGTLPLRGDVARLADVLALPETERQALRTMLLERATALDTTVEDEVTFDRVALALAEGFSRALNLELIPGTLSAAEQEQAVHFKEKYAGDEWTFRR
jgi:lipoate-protein ligase A